MCHTEEFSGSVGSDWHATLDRSASDQLLVAPSLPYKPDAGGLCDPFSRLVVPKTNQSSRASARSRVASASPMPTTEQSSTKVSPDATPVVGHAPLNRSRIRLRSLAWLGSKRKARTSGLRLPMLPSRASPLGKLYVGAMSADWTSASRFQFSIARCRLRERWAMAD
jgi:hypothetical protein